MLPRRDARAPKSKLLTAFFLSVGFFFAIVVVYRALRYGFDFTGEPVNYDRSSLFAFHYTLPALAAAGLFVASATPYAIKRVLAVVLVSAGFALYLADAYVAWRDLRSPNTEEKRMLWVAAREGIEPDRRDLLEVLDELRGRGTEATLAVLQRGWLPKNSDGKEIHSIFELDGEEVLPLGGLPRTTVVDCNDGGYAVAFQTDEHGFRNPLGLWRPDEVDVAVIGDSYVYGTCVRDEDTIVAPIRTRYPRSLNLGAQGSGFLLELATLKEYLIPIRPKVVVWVFFEGNDFQNLEQRERYAPILRKYLEPGEFRQRLMERISEIEKKMKDWVMTWEEEGREMYRRQRAGDDRAAQVLEDVALLRHVRKIAFDAIVKKIRPYENDYLERVYNVQDTAFLERVVREAKRTVESWGGRFIFVYLPNRLRFCGLPEFRVFDADCRKTIAYYWPRDPHAQVKEAVLRLGITFIDAYKAMFADPRPARFTLHPFSHLSPQGYRVVADLVLKELE